MRYYKARQRNSDSRWDYTCRAGDYVYPTGYCHCFVEFDKTFFPNAEELNKSELPFADKYHINGHDTSEQAEECYRDYLLDHRLSLGMINESIQEKCKVCGAFTQLYALLDEDYFVLCEKHNNRIEIEKLFKAPSEIWSS